MKTLDEINEEIDYQELEDTTEDLKQGLRVSNLSQAVAALVTEDLKQGLRVGNLSQAVVALGLLTRYVDGLVEEQNRWKRKELGEKET